MVPEGSPDPLPRPPKRVIRHLNQEQVAELVACYAAKISIAELVERFQIDQGTVQRHVRRYGLPRRARRLSPAQIDEVVRLYLAGQSAQSVASEFQVGDSTVRKYVVKAGFQVRLRGRSKRGAERLDRKCRVDGYKNPAIRTEP